MNSVLGVFNGQCRLRRAIVVVDVLDDYAKACKLCKTRHSQQQMNALGGLFECYHSNNGKSFSILLCLCQY